ncbi:hypothetical protein BAUCODRAFT_474459 [Baudoinia panamericana UAMH 10762]|uniref:Heterokaryon incompatibility domain-containing protein n=1 Tax=Baudoinia panamericana (strain UAMH 10762) TaxID=717646 RepID=M2MIC3_BAUPA|nr:uncharacterized protein BAUCODRAFT_474459 [Baudoinia panamericana UAMH 10762]EMC96421.1 hypothetical protein BAUCODRAFT_474459 [Baudoinia panamericana UAMH 10762]
MACLHARLLNDCIDQQYGYYSHFKIEYRALSLMNDLRERHCSRPVDKIYGMLGLLRHTGKAMHIVPDYRKSVAEVYTETVRELIRSDQSLSVLLYVDHRPGDFQSSADQFPSWVPRWDRPLDFMHDPHYMFLNGSGAAAGIPATVKETSEPEGHSSSVLSVKGIMIGTIVETAPGFTPRPDDDRVCENPMEVLTGMELLFEHAKPSQASVSWDSQAAIAMTVCAAHEDRGNPTEFDSRAGYILFKDRVQQGLKVPDFYDIDEKARSSPAGEASKFQRDTIQTCLNRKAFVTGKGYIGLGPRFLKPGDVVAVLYGLEVPAILRPVDSHYLFLGEAYVYGIMDGEAVENREAWGLSEEWFEMW